MKKEKPEIIQVLAVAGRCTECGWSAQPVMLAYNQVTHSQGLWCQTCFAQLSERGQFSPKKEVSK